MVGLIWEILSEEYLLLWKKIIGGKKLDNYKDSWNYLNNIKKIYKEYLDHSNNINHLVILLESSMKDGLIHKVDIKRNYNNY